MNGMTGDNQPKLSKRSSNRGDVFA